MADPAIESLVGFEMGPATPGGAPLYLHPNGNFYATSSTGGAFVYNGTLTNTGSGTVYQVTLEGEVGGLSFGALPGKTPNSACVLSADGWLWGSTAKGTLYGNNGTVFRVHPDTGAFQTIYQVSTDGTNAVSNLVRDPATGLMWGTAGATTFKIDELTGAYSIGGQAPAAATGEVDDGSGFLWGLTQTGNGTVYKKEIATSNVTTVVTFSGTSGSFPGTAPLGPLVLENGHLWGVTTSGGTGTNPGLGTVFKIKVSDATYSTVQRFGSLTGANAGIRNPANGLASDGKGSLWGIASAGGGSSAWWIYKISSTDGSFTKVSEFGPGTNNSIYTALTNTAATAGRVPYKGLSGNATDPYLWGTTSEGGTKGWGTLFRYNPSTNHYQVMVNFSGTSPGFLGGRANGRLLVDDDGVIWGTTEMGGANGTGYGTVFKYTPSAQSFTTLHSFNLGGNGGYPRSGLVDDGNGFLWGTASSSPNGVIYKVNKTTGAVSVVYAFPSSPTSEGSTPEGDLLPDGKGNLWGSTISGGTSGNGVLFKFNTTTNAYTAMVKFSGNITGVNAGRQPSGPLVMDDNGAIWGTTAYTVFKYVPATATLTTVFSKNDNVLTLPLTEVSVGTISKTSEGKIRFLGTEGTKDLTTSGDTNRICNRAVINEIDPTTDTVTQVQSLAESIVSSPVDFTPAGGLYEHNDGRFYGLLKFGGQTDDGSPAGGGMIYRVSGGATVMTQDYSSTNTNFNTLVSLNTATLRGYANPNGKDITCAFEWGPTSKLGNEIAASLTSGSADTSIGIYSASLNDLAPESTYFYRILARTAAGAPAYGPLQTFKTGSPAADTNPEISVESPIGQVLADGGTADLGKLEVGKSYRQSVVVRNLGTSELNNLAASITGDAAADFVIVKPLGATSLAYSPLNTGLLIAFTPTASGPRTATLTLTSNDDDEASFELTLQGEGVVEPEIEVLSPASTALQSGTSYSFNNVAVNTQVTRTFTVRNTGNADLASILTSISGPHSLDFEVTELPSSSIAPDETTTFGVTFTPSESGLRNATLEILSNDADEASFFIQLSGSGVLAPEIEVMDGLVDLVDGGQTLDIGSVNTGTSVTRTVTIFNSGSANLTGLSVSITGTDAADFTRTQPLTTLPPGEQATFNVTITPSAVGTRNASLQIASNDDDENPFDISLTGIGVTAPEIVVESPQGNGLVDEVSSLSFGKVNTGTTSQKTVFIRNSGTAALTGLTLAITGSGSNKFSFTPLNTTSLAPSSTTSFALTFTPTADETSDASVEISSNDEDEPVFHVAISGIGHVPQGPLFETQPDGLLTLLGQPAGFTASVTGDPLMTYQWKKGTKPIAGATQPFYTLPATKTSDVGEYSLVADNPVGGPVTSRMVHLGVITPLTGSKILKKGTQLTLASTVAYPKVPGVSVAYQWLRDDLELEDGDQPSGSLVAGAKTANLKLTKTMPDDSGVYTCRVTLDTPNNDPELTHGNLLVGFVDAVPVLDPIPLPSSASVSEFIDYTLNATNYPTSFSATGLPKGLTLNTKTGRITGRPTEASKLDKEGNPIPSKIVAKATNPWGTSLPEELEMTIEPLDSTLVGTFNGVVARSAHSNFGMGGLVQITVAKTGVVSGSVTLAGQKHSVTGTLDTTIGGNPSGQLTVKRTPASQGDLFLDINITTGDDLMQGMLRDPHIHNLMSEIALGSLGESDLVNGSMLDVRLNSPRGIVLDNQGYGFIADTGNHVIRFVDPMGGEVTTFVGTATAGSADDMGTAASLNSPEGMALDKNGNLFVADTGNATIRKITPEGLVTTFAGSAGQFGTLNGTGSTARFKAPCALCFDPAGILYVVDRGSHTLRKITPAGVVTTLAGKADAPGYKDGSGTSAQFNTPQGIAYDPLLKALFVTDALNKVIRKVSLSGTTSTYAGSPGVAGYDDGLLTNSRFMNPLGIVSCGNGSLIVGDYLIRKIGASGIVSTISEEIDSVDNLDRPIALAYNEDEESVLAVHDQLHIIAGYKPDTLSEDAVFNARRNAWTSANAAPDEIQGLFNAVISNPVTDDPTLPQGDGYAQVTIGKLGTAAWAGRTADGTTFTLGTFIGGDYSIPLHAMLYKKTGSLQGSCSIDPSTGDIVSNMLPTFDWYKIPQPLALTDRSYKAGFEPHPLDLFGGRYVPNNLHDYLGLSGSPADLELDFADSLISGFQQPFTLTAPNTVLMPAPQNSMTLKIDPKTGIFSGGFKHGSPSYAVPFQGLLINYSTGGDLSGHGHYLLPTSGAKDAPITSSPVRLRP
jgi:uncharacterized repeat protein (TIGR03803 family)